MFLTLGSSIVKAGKSGAQPRENTHIEAIYLKAKLMGMESLNGLMAANL